MKTIRAKVKHYKNGYSTHVVCGLNVWHRQFPLKVVKAKNESWVKVVLNKGRVVFEVADLDGSILHLKNNIRTIIYSVPVLHNYRACQYE